MILYYDKFNNLKEVINDKAIVESTTNNQVWLYFEGFDNYSISSVVARFKSVDDETYDSGLINLYYDATSQNYISYNKDRDLKYFEYGKEYKFYKCNIPTDAPNGAIYANVLVEINAGSTHPQLTLTPFTFKIESNAVVPTQRITISEYLYLLSRVQDAKTTEEVINIVNNILTSYYDIQAVDNLLEGKVDKVENPLHLEALAYIVNQAGETTIIPINTYPVANTVVKRDSTGAILGNTTEAGADLQLVNKEFYFNHLDGSGLIDTISIDGVNVPVVEKNADLPAYPTRESLGVNDLEEQVDANVSDIAELNERVDNISSIGRFLSYWNCETGLPYTNPETIPYEYKTGDFYIIGKVANLTQHGNYIPNGLQYTGSASFITGAEDFKKGDIFRFDGTVWAVEITTQRDTYFGDIIGEPTDNAKLSALFSQIDEDIASLQDDVNSKAEKYTGTGFRLFATENGNQMFMPYASSPIANDIAQYTNRGTLQTNDPTNEKDSANKKYVDEVVVRERLTGATQNLTLSDKKYYICNDALTSLTIVSLTTQLRNSLWEIKFKTGSTFTFDASEVSLNWLSGTPQFEPNTEYTIFIEEGITVATYDAYIVER